MRRAGADPAARCRGFALVMAAGMLALLLLLAIGMFSVQAASLRTLAGARGSAGLAAESGLEYAAARLWADPRRPAADARTPENACDDWSWRGEETEPLETAPGASRHPSYRRGTSSGRLRGDPARRFALIVRGGGGFIGINSGEIADPLADRDSDGVLNRDDPAPDDADGNGVPDWRDPECPANRHLVNLLDNLGAVLGLSDVADEPFAPACPRLGVIPQSGLGRAVVAHRPRGGYSSVDQAAPFLPPADFKKAAPYLCVEGEETPVSCDALAQASWAQTVAHDAVWPEARCESRARIDLNTAPLPVLQAALRHLTAGGGSFVRLGADEADRAARALCARRPFWTWKQVLAGLHDAELTDGIFEADPFIAGGDAVQALLKEDLILAQLGPAGYFPDPFRWQWDTLDVPREPRVVGPDATRIRRIYGSLLTVTPLMTHPFNDAGQRLDNVGGTPAQVPPRPTAGCVLDAWPGRFRILSEGGVAGEASARRKADLAHHQGTFLLAGQQNLEGRLTADPADLFPGSWDFPGGGLSIDPAQPSARTGTQTWPRFPFHSQFTNTANYECFFPAARYARTVGSVALSARQHDFRGPGGASALEETVFSLPYNEDPGADAARNPVPPTTYGPDRWEDNLCDPIDDPGVARPGPSPTVYEPTVDLWPRGFDLGFGTSPSGVRFRGAWIYEFSEPPLPRAANDAGSPEFGEITGGALAFRFPTLAEDDGPSTCVEIFCKKSKDWLVNDWLSVLTVTGKSDGGLHLRAVGTSAIEENSYACPDPTLPWHHAVLRFEAGPGSDESSVSVYLDGILAAPGGPTVVAFSASGAVYLRVKITPPLDDLMMFPPAGATPEAIRERAGKGGSRFVEAGSWRSARLVFDPDRFPGGARLRALFWDGFVPERTGGGIVLSAVGRAEDGSIVAGGVSSEWAGSGPAGTPLSGTGVRSLECQVTIRTDRAAWPVVAGEPVLLASPQVDEIRVAYGDGPRWTSYER